MELKRNNVPNSILNRKQELLKNAVSEQMRQGDRDRGRGSLRKEGTDDEGTSELKQSFCI